MAAFRHRLQKRAHLRKLTHHENADDAHHREQVEPADLASVHHHISVGLVLGERTPPRADRVPRYGHGPRPYTDAAVPKLHPHEHLEGNRPVSEALSRTSHGNIASRPGGRDDWEKYARDRSATRTHRHAAKTHHEHFVARGHRATGHLGEDLE